MRDIFKIFILFIILLVLFTYRNNIATYITDEIVYNGSNKILTYNEYYMDNNFLYVQNTDVNTASNYQEILNIFYTYINSGDDSFSFYCNYDDCMEDIKNITNDPNIVSNINNFVHPYNSFSSINIDINTNNMITLKAKKVYNKEKINFINNYISDFINSNVNISMNNYDKIKVFHDHIVNNTKYDENLILESYTAYDLIISGISICGGYSDIISIYLHALGIKNYKITSENHIWNLIELDGVWYHLDATWNDPIASDGKQYLLHNFFMITTNKLFELDTVEHNYNKNVFLEANY